MKKFVFILPFVLLFSLGSCSAKERGANPKLASSNDFKIESVYEGDDVVWGFDFIDESRMLIGHRGGKLFLYNLKSKEAKELKAPEVHSDGQGGLLDIAIKEIDGKKFVYMTFSKPVEDGVAVSALARAEFKGDKLEGLKTIFSSNARGEGSIHFGSRLAFDKESLFMTVGDRGQRALAQDITKHNGKTLRLDFDGKPHSDNPFVGKSALDEIYTYGHRNPQGIDFDPVSKQLYLVEMGPRGGDELHRLSRGKNYGWPEITYGREYYGPKIGATEKEGMEQPVTYWVPSISPSGMAFYTGDKISQWKNELFLACLSGSQVRKLSLKEGEVAEQTALFMDMNERFRQVKNAPDGYLYLSTDSGKIFRVGSKK